MKKIYYWSPFIGKIATIKAVINSASSINKFTKKKLEASIINCYGEWDAYGKILKKKEVKKINLQNTFKVNTNLSGYLYSRVIFFFSIFFLYFNLKKLLKKSKPDVLIIHLLTYIPLILFCFNDIPTKLYLRISGKPRLGIFRKILWKYASKKITKIFCPTKQTKKILEEQKIFGNKKIHFLPDPVIESNVKVVSRKKYDFKNKKFYLSVGRLSAQKNHQFLINCFKKSKIDSKLLIIGDGELKKTLQNQIKTLHLSSKVQLIKFKKNINYYYKNAKAVIITSLWEDPGFVMIEAGFNQIPIITSNCESGPKEFIENSKNGYLFSSNNYSSFDKTFLKFKNDSDKNIKDKINGAFKKSLIYTEINHYNLLKNHIN